MQRVLAAALLHNGTTIIHNPGHSDDDRAAAGIIQALGAELDHTSPAVIVRSTFLHDRKEVDKKIKDSPIELYCGESGLSIRMFTLVASLLDRDVIINGAGSLVNRPMHFFDEVFPQLGVQIRSDQGKLPIKIHGPLKPANIEIDGSLSSQFLTGLLMAYSASNAENVSIRVKDLKSKPYIDLTLDVMKQFDMRLPQNREYKEFVFDQGPSPSGNSDAVKMLHKHKTINIEVESDWSNAAFLLVAGAIAGPIRVTGLDLSSAQADKAILDALMLANAGLAVEAKGIKVHPSDMSAFDFDATDCPDLFPPLVALASFCRGVSSIKGVSRLIHKESDRNLSLREEFGKMGVTIKFNNDNMLIEGNSFLKGATVHAHHDHRIAMACTVAALGAQGETILHDAEAVNKSYPNFYDHLKKLGADVSLDNKINLHE